MLSEKVAFPVVGPASVSPSERFAWDQGGALAPTLQYDFINNPSLTGHALAPDLSITRATKATMVDADGYIREVQAGEARFTGATFANNLHEQSEDFSATGWAQAEVTLTPDQYTDPNGGTTMDKAVANATTAQHIAAYSNSTLINGGKAGDQILISCYFRYINHQYVQLRTTAGTNIVAGFDLLNGTAGTGSVGASNIAVEAIDTNLYRCSFVATITGVPSQFAIFIAEAADGVPTSWLAAGTETIGIWGLQYEIVSGSGRTTPSTYIPTTTVAKTSLTGTSTKGLLVEEARTNIARSSEDITNGTYWATHPDTLAFVGNEATAPDGSQTGDLIIDDSGGGTSTNVRASHPDTYSTSTAYTVSLYIKAGGLDWARMDISAMGALSLKASFDLTNGVVGATVGSDVTSTFIEDAGNGWYRCGFTFTSDATDTTGTMDVRPANGNDNVTVDRDGTSSIYVWGLQIEAGAFPTSYIPTTTASVTRNADDIRDTDTSWYNQTEGSFYVQARHLPTNLVPSAEALMNLYIDGSNEWKIGISGGAEGRYRTDGRSGGANVWGIFGDHEAGDAVLQRIVAAAKVNDIALYIDGNAKTPDTSAAMPSGSVDTLFVGQDNGLEFFNGHIAEIRYYNQRLPDPQLESLSLTGTI